MFSLLSDSHDCSIALQVQHLINALNEATNHIPGWDSYSASGKATDLWDGSLS